MMDYKRGRVTFDPEGYAPNMRWALVDPRGQEMYRGPEWAVRLRHSHAVRLDTGLRDRVKVRGA